MGTQSYTLRLSSQNRLSLSRAGFFHGFALGLWKENKETFRLRHEREGGGGDACVIHRLLRRVWGNVP